MYEIKFDGYRLMVRLEDDHATIFTRNGHDWTHKLPALARELGTLGLADGWLDGEAVVLDEQGHPRFNLLQNALDAARSDAAFYYARALRALGREVVQPYYVSLRPDEDEGTAPVPTRHFIAQMCALAGIRGEIALRPYLHLTATERAAGQLAARQVVIHSSGRTRGFASANKEWIPGRFQEVVAAARGKYDFVQLGSPDDPPLAGARDLRGRTSLRESAAIVAGARAVVCQEGFLMHLARAVEVRAVVIYGGALDPAITGYRANENLFTPVACAPCWRRNRCDFAHRCMTEIGADAVLRALERAVERHGTALPVDEALCP